MDILLKIASQLKYREARILLYQNLAGGFRCDLYRASERKGEVNTEVLLKNIRETGPLSDRKLFPAEIPVILCLQGEGLVQRIFPGDASEIKKQIPNFRENDYILQQHALDRERTFAALFRRDKVQKILEELAGANVLISNISPGFSAFIEFSHAFDFSGGSLTVGCHRLELEDKKVQAVSKIEIEAGEPDPVSFLEQSKARETIAMGAGISFFVHAFKESGAGSGIPDFNIRELTAAKLNRLLVKYALPALLGVLLINFIVFDHLQGRLQTTDTSRTAQKELALRVEQLKNEISAEKQFAVKGNLQKPHPFAFYIDRLAALNAAGVRFEELAVDPVQAKIRPSEKMGIEPGRIVLKGSCDQADSFGNLLVSLSAASWVSKIEKQTYTYDNTSASAKFEVILHYKTEKINP